MMDTILADKEGIAQEARTEADLDPPILSSGPLGWNGLIAERFRHPLDEYHFPALSENMVSLYLGKPVHSVRWSGYEIHEGPTSRDDVTVNVSGLPASWRFDGDVDVLVMRLTPAFLSRLATETGMNADAVALRTSFDRRDDTVKYVGLAMLTEMEAGGPSGRLYGESLATALAAHLLHAHRASPQTVPEGKGRLPRSGLKLVTDYVNDHLSEDLGLSEMAGIANLSPYHFSRQFKRSTGLSPHQYVIGRRVARARELLSGTELPVGDVASAVGFSNQSHLAYYIRRRFGVAPSSLRR